MKIIILGAGVVGVTTAYFLAKSGHEVTVIDRGEESARECSFANGGQLSYCHSEPWASPAVLPKIVKWLGKKDAPLIFRLRFDPAMFAWGIKFLMHCTTRKNLEGTANVLRLALFSREMLREVAGAENIEYNYLGKGILHIFKSQHDLDDAITHAKFQEPLGAPFAILSKAEAIAMEPALATTSQEIVGALHFPLDESGDIFDFTVKLSKILQEKYGVAFHYNTNILSLAYDGNKITSVRTDKGNYEADKYVISLGAYSTRALKSVGISAPIYPMKGYSISIPIAEDSNAPFVSITDQSHKIVYSRLGNILRVAGTAEFAGYNHDIREERIEPIKNAAQALFPQAGDFTNIGKWACLRPSTPDGAPLIGQAIFENLLINTGHGTLGWTLSFGSAKIIQELAEGRKSPIDMAGLDLKRIP